MAGCPARTVGIGSITTRHTQARTSRTLRAGHRLLGTVLTPVASSTTLTPLCSFIKIVTARWTGGAGGGSREGRTARWTGRGGVVGAGVARGTEETFLGRVRTVVPVGTGVTVRSS